MFNKPVKKPIMKNVLIGSTFAIVFSLCKISVYAQGSINVGADLVSSYIWRGIAQGSNEPNIQPSISYTNNKISIGTWGSGNFSGSLKEIDFFATYAISNKLSITITDYNWTFSKSFFDYSKKTDHIYEASITYTGGSSFPVNISCNTMFAGSDKDEDGDNAYSTYLELGYPLFKNARIFCGASLSESPAVYYTKSFGIINTGIKVSKNIEITNKFSLPLYGIAGFNPNAGKAFLVAGITL